MTDKETEVTFQALLATFFRKLLGKDFLMMAAFAAAIAYLTLYARETQAQVNATQIDAGIKAEREERQRLRDEFDAHMKDDRESKRALIQQINELAADNRALYRTIQTGARQERLERPLVMDAGRDGGE